MADVHTVRMHYTYNDSTVEGITCAAPAQVNAVRVVSPTSQKFSEEQLQASI